MKRSDNARGGRTRAARLSPARISEIGRKAARARWGKARGEPTVKETLAALRDAINAASPDLFWFVKMLASAPESWQHRLARVLTEAERHAIFDALGERFQSNNELKAWFIPNQAIRDFGNALEDEAEKK